MDGLEHNVTVVIIHDSYFQPQLMHQFGARLQSHGFAYECPKLPSCDAKVLQEKPEVTMQEDADSLLKVLNRLIEDEGRLVLLIAHGYGGLPATQIIHYMLEFNFRCYGPEKGGIIGILYVCAFVGPHTHIESAHGDKPAPWVSLHVSLEVL